MYILYFMLFLALELKCKELTKLECNAAKEEADILKRSRQKEENIKRYQEELRGLFNEERKSQKEKYRELLRRIEEMVNQKERYDSVSLYQETMRDRDAELVSIEERES